MAIALVGSAVVPTGNPTTGFTLTIPSQVLSGHLCFLALTSRDSTGAGTLSVTDNDTGGNTWTKIANSTDHKATLWYKRATSATASKTITVANAVGSSSGVLKCFSGADSGATPYTNIVLETNASGNETHAGFTPTNADSMVCCAVFNIDNDNAVTSLSFATLGATTATEKTSTGGSDCGCIFGHALQAGAAAATGNLTWAQTDGNTYSITWAIKPAAALSLALAQGTFTLTGQAVATRWNRRLVAAQGSFALTGNEVTLPGKVTDNLIGHWKMNEAAGSTRNDSWSTNHAILSGTVTQETGLLGNAAGFDETGHLQVTDNQAISPTGDITLCALYFHNNTGTVDFPALIGKWDVNQRSFALIFNRPANRFAFMVSSNGTSTTAELGANTFGAPSNNTWYWVWGRVKHATDQIQIRVSTTSSIGTWDSVSYTGSSLFNSTANLEFGRLQTSGNRLKGRLDSCWFWGAAVDDSILAQVWNNGSGLELAAPIAHAGYDQVRTEGESVMLDSSRSTDDVAVTGRTWSQISGTSVTLSNVNAVNPTFTAPSAPATLVFEVEVENALSQISTDQVTISIVSTASTVWRWHAPQEANFDPVPFYIAFDALPSPCVVIRNGRMIAAKGNVAQVGYTWSASKMLTSLIFARQRQLGNIAYSDTIPGSDNPTSPTATALQFLQMTSDFGLSPHSPGDNYAYNNGAIHHFGTHLKTTFYSGDDHVETLENAYFAALDPEDSLIYEATTWAGDNHMSGWNGGWGMSTRDLARIARLILQNGVWDGTQVLDEDFCVNKIFSLSIPGAASASTDTDDEFYNQSGTTAVMKPQWGHGFWYVPVGFSGAVYEAGCMFGKYGTSVWMSKLKDVAIVACNVGGQIDGDSPANSTNLAQYEAILNAARNAYTLSANNAAFTQSGQSASLLRSHRASLAQGSLTETGNAVGLTTGRLLAADVGTFTETGSNTSLLVGYKTTLDSGSFSLTGNTANLLRGLKALFASGTFSETGNEVLLKLGRLISLAAGSVALTGNAVTLTKTGALSLAIETGSFTQSGQAANLLRGRVLAAESGSLALTGNALELVRTFKLSATGGSFAESGFATNLLLNRLIALASGGFSETGQSVTLLRSSRLTIEADSFLETGFAQSLLRSRLLTAETGSFLESGSDAPLLHNRLITITSGSFAESGQAIGLQAARILGAITGGFSLTGNQATLTYATARTLVVNGGSFALTGQGSEFRITRLLPIDNSSFSLSGSNTGLRSGRNIVIQPGSYSLDGAAVGLRNDRRISIDVGSFFLSGSDIDLRTVQRLAAALGAFTLTGHAVILSFSGIDLTITPSAIITVMSKPIATLSVQSKPSASITKWPS